MTELPVFDRVPPGTQPAYLHPPYRSSMKRAPTQPLILLPNTLSERTGPVFGQSAVAPTDSDLTAQHAGAPLGERIVVSGRGLDEGGRPVSAQKRSARCSAGCEFQRMRANLHRCGRAIQIFVDQAGSVSLEKSSQRLAAGAHSLFDLWGRAAEPAGDANVFSRRPAAAV